MKKHLWLITCAMVMAASTQGYGQVSSRPTPPPEPAVKPIVSAPLGLDKDQTRIDDRIESSIATAKKNLASHFVTSTVRASAQRTLDERITVQCIFSSQITQTQIDAFIQTGGTITYVYRSATYGWIGNISRSAISGLPAKLGSDLLGIVGEIKMKKHLDRATQCGRVRPVVWDEGYDGDMSESLNKITIAILDTGVDGTHTDLAGRMEYWHDYTPDAHPTPQDVGHHGSHVAGIATGTGAASAVNPNELSYVDLGSVPDVGGFLSPIAIPESLTTFNFNSTVRWDADGSLEILLGHLNYLPDRTFGLQNLYTTSTISPFSNIETGMQNPAVYLEGGNPVTGTNLFMAYVQKNNSGAGTPGYAIDNTVTYASPGDGYNTLRGVAPGCKWAGFKVFDDEGNSASSYGDSAISDLIDLRETHRIKVANMSFGVPNNNDAPGTDTITRNIVNTAASNGIVMVVSAGNSGRTAAGGGEIGDPGRSEYAITVAASSDINQLTDYSSHGFPAPGDTSNGDQDMKPDITAPGGSAIQSMILSVDSNTCDSETTGPNVLPDAVPNNYLNIMGTSMAAPFITGCAALVIDAMQQNGQEWHYTGPEALQDVLFVKMVLLMTATETNQARENGGFTDPTLDRGGKDINEGYGLVNADAAIDAVRSVPLLGEDLETSGTFGSEPYDERCWASPIHLTQNVAVQLTLHPAAGDYDLYLYSGTPDTYGNPVILSKSTLAGLTLTETINYTPTASETGYVVVKRVSGSGLWQLTADVPSAIGDWRAFE